MPASAEIPAAVRLDVEILWDYHNMHHTIRPADIGIGLGLGSHDLGVATYAAELYQQGMFPRIVFTGANAPTTIERFPRGEAVHYAEHATELGVPADAILSNRTQPTPGRTSSSPAGYSPTMASTSPRLF